MTKMRLTFKKYDEMILLEKLGRNRFQRNKHSKTQIERLAKLMREHGVRHPIHVNQKTMEIAFGHGRKEAALLNGWKEYPIVYQDFKSDEEEYAVVQSDNAIALWAALDINQIMEDIKRFPKFDPELLGIKNFKMPLEMTDGKIGDDEVPEPLKDRVKSGDIWALGDHRLMCGSALLIDDVEKLMDGKKADLILTDPPYNVGVNEEDDRRIGDGRNAAKSPRNRRKDGMTIQNDKMDEKEFEDFLRTTFSNYFAIARDACPIYVFYADSMCVPFVKTFGEAGFHFAQNCIWNKQQIVMTRKDFHYKHEPIIYGWRKGAKHPWYSDRKQSSVWDFDRPFKSELHPTMKPINLLEYPLACSSRSGDLVVDLFGGSGSTLIAAQKTGRRCYTMELDPKFASVILERWEKFTGEKGNRV